MKPTPVERLALDKARTLTPLSQEEAAAIANAPDLLDFARRHDRVRLAQIRLVWATEDWERRELRISLYRCAVRDGDRTEITHQRVTAFDTPTQRIRDNLVYRFRRLQEAEAAAYRLF
jgi:hypothetical protein